MAPAESHQRAHRADNEDHGEKGGNHGAGVAPAAQAGADGDEDPAHLAR